ncbi:hypothetical protein [Chromobacterium sphagni]|uniref:hypothetical protein n=1 Tax=Chromobacterium sphagni TaxID=1903179 RepID=UPI0011134E4C|nr:hypothetical protein [Chromobacterium sphagni]
MLDASLLFRHRGKLASHHGACAKAPAHPKVRRGKQHAESAVNWPLASDLIHDFATVSHPAGLLSDRLKRVFGFDPAFGSDRTSRRGQYYQARIARTLSVMEITSGNEKDCLRKSILPIETRHKAQLIPSSQIESQFNTHKIPLAILFCVYLINLKAMRHSFAAHCGHRRSQYNIELAR